MKIKETFVAMRRSLKKIERTTDETSKEFEKMVAAVNDDEIKQMLIANRYALPIA